MSCPASNQFTICDMGGALAIGFMIVRWWREQYSEKHSDFVPTFIKLILPQ